MNSFVPSRSRRRYRLAVEAMEPRWFLSASTLAIEPSSDMLLESSQQAIVLLGSEANFLFSTPLETPASSESPVPYFPVLNEIDFSVVPTPDRSAQLTVIDVRSFLSSDALLDFVATQQGLSNQVYYSTSWNGSNASRNDVLMFQRIVRPSEDSGWIDIGSDSEPSTAPPVVAQAAVRDVLDDLPLVDMMGSQGQSSLFQFSTLGSGSNSGDPQSSPRISSFSMDANPSSPDRPTHDARSSLTSNRSSEADTSTSATSLRSSEEQPRTAMVNDFLSGMLTERLERHAALSHRTSNVAQTTPSSTTSHMPSSVPTPTHQVSPQAAPTERSRHASSSDDRSGASPVTEALVGSWIPIGGLRLDVSAAQKAVLSSVPQASNWVEASTAMMAATDPVPPDQRSEATEATSRNGWVWQQLIGSTTAERLTRAIVVGLFLPILPRYRSEKERRTAES